MSVDTSTGNAGSGRVSALLVGVMALALALPATLLATDDDAPLTPSPEPLNAPQFSAIDTEGRLHRISDYHGQVLLVNFWATWCAPCVKEMPALQRAWEQLRDDGVQVLGINMGETAEDIAAFTLLTPVDFPLLLDENMELGPQWSLKGLPTTYIVAPDGEVVYAVLGEREWDDPALLEEIRALSRR